MNLCCCCISQICRYQSYLRKKGRSSSCCISNDSLSWQLLLHVKGEDESLAAAVVEPFPVGVPEVVGKVADCSSKLSPDQNQGVLPVVSFLVETSLLKLCSDALNKISSFFTFLGLFKIDSRISAYPELRLRIAESKRVLLHLLLPAVSLLVLLLGAFE